MPFTFTFLQILFVAASPCYTRRKNVKVKATVKLIHGYFGPTYREGKAHHHLDEAGFCFIVSQSVSIPVHT